MSALLASCSRCGRIGPIAARTTVEAAPLGERRARICSDCWKGSVRPVLEAVGVLAPAALEDESASAPAPYEAMPPAELAAKAGALVEQLKAGGAR